MTSKKRARSRSSQKSRCLPDAFSTAQSFHIIDVAILWNEALVLDVLDILIDISSMGVISSCLEPTEHYIQSREQSEGAAATTTPPTSDEDVPR